MPLGLVALAIGGFGIGLTEFVIMGLLPEVAADFGVTEAAAGWLISGYALAVVVGALGLTAATTRLPRKPVLMGLLVLFIVGNALSALAPTYEVMMTGRVIAALVPALHRDGPAPSLRREFGAFRSGQVWLSLLVTVLGFGGMFGAFTYIAYTLTEVSGFDATAVPWLLVLFGAGLVVGNWVGGRLADRSIDGTLLVFIGALVVVLALFAWLAWSPIATVVLLVLMGAFGFGTVPGLQSRIMRYAASAPTLASGANIGAFNLGNALGAFAGGVGISVGLGYTSPIWAGAIITLAALAVMAVAALTARRAERADAANAPRADAATSSDSPEREPAASVA